MNKIKYFFSPEYLFATNSQTKFQLVYLLISLGMIVVVIVARIALARGKETPKVLKGFYKLWTWGYILIGITGLFVWFSRTQALPVFSTRIISYIWILILVAFSGYVLWYGRTQLERGLTKYHEQQRKAKYLKK